MRGDDHQPIPDDPAIGSGELVRFLKGELPCARCGYELRGLSIRGSCPECGLLVRATLLAAVDPAAEELQPLSHPRLVVAGLWSWAGGALVAALSVLAIRLLVLLGLAGAILQTRLALVGVVGLFASWAGATALISPHRGMPRSNIVRALIAIVAYAGVVAGFVFIHVRFDPGQFDQAYLRPGLVLEERSTARLLMGACMLVAIVGLRPNARLLASRSLVMRTGRVDRQQMYAMAAAIAVGMLGDALHLVTPTQSGIPREILWAAGTILIAVGSMLLLWALAGIVLDAYRVGRVLLEPAPSLRDVLEGRAARRANR